MNPEATDANPHHDRIRNHDNLEELSDDLAAAHIEGHDCLGGTQPLEDPV